MIPQLERLSPAGLQALIQGSEVLEQDVHGPKVLRLQNGNILKFFRLKRLWSSALLKPYSKRFCLHAEALRQRGVPTVALRQRFSLDGAITAVQYDPLPGLTLRQLAPLSEAQLEQFGRFVARLHHQGVFFRSMHLGNVVLTPEGELGLIDIADMSLYRRPLCASQRRRNLRHILRDRRDRASLGSAGLEALARGYGAEEPRYAERMRVDIQHVATSLERSQR